MSKIEEAIDILKQLGMGKITVSTPYCLLALADIKEDDNWESATNEWMIIRKQMDFMAEYYQKYTPQTQEKAYESRACIR